MINVKTRDFNQRFLIGHGTSFLATMDTPSEVWSFLSGDISDLTRHFCKIYDRDTMRYTSGCLWLIEDALGHDPETAEIWQLWA